MGHPGDRLAQVAQLSTSEAAALRALGHKPVRHRRGQVIRHEGASANSVYLLLDGWAMSSMMLFEGHRFISKIHLPTDILGTASMSLQHAAQTLTAVTECTTTEVPYRQIRELFEREPRLSALFSNVAQIERLALLERAASMAAFPGRERVLLFVLELLERLERKGLAPLGRFELHLTQEQIGDAVGLTSVYVCRSLRDLERAGLIERNGRDLRINVDAARASMQIRPRRLHFGPAWIPSPRTDAENGRHSTDRPVRHQAT